MDETTQPSTFASAETYEGTGGWGERMRKNTSSVLLPIIALLVLAGGVYFYTRGRSLTEQPVVEFQGTEENTQTTVSPASENKVTLSPEGKPVISAGTITVQGNMFKTQAQHGEGITHLARRAAQEYLAQTNPGFALTKEHKIYIEDFLKRNELAKRGGKSVLRFNEEIRFSNQLMKQAVESAKTLSPQQLKHLAQFSARVVQL